MKKQLLFLCLLGGSLFAETTLVPDADPGTADVEEAAAQAIVTEGDASGNEQDNDAEAGTVAPEVKAAPSEAKTPSVETNEPLTETEGKKAQPQALEKTTTDPVIPKPLEDPRPVLRTPPATTNTTGIVPPFRHSTGLETSSPASFDSVYNTVLRRRLEVGFRTVSHDLDVDGEKIGNQTTLQGTYFGSINELQLYDDDIQKVYIQYAIIPYAGVGVTWDEMDIATKDGPSENNTDGDVNVETDMLYLFVRYPINIPDTDVQVTPFVEFGKADHGIGFDAETSWASRGNSVDLSDESGTYYAYGLEVTFNERFSAHVIWRRSELTTTGEYRNRDGRAPTPVEMRLDHDSFGFGAKFIF